MDKAQRREALGLICRAECEVYGWTAEEADTLRADVAQLWQQDQPACIAYLKAQSALAADALQAFYRPMGVFVFGSNLAGRHGAGAALYAREHHGAIIGQGEGRQGGAYAIPTKDRNLKPLPLLEIAGHVAHFLEYAEEHPAEVFVVTRIGCGLAGYNPEQIAPFFAGAPCNCILPNWYGRRP